MPTRRKSVATSPQQRRTMVASPDFALSLAAEIAHYAEHQKCECLALFLCSRLTLMAFREFGISFLLPHSRLYFYISSV